MQPLVYLAIRAVLGWLQFVERADRAFLRNSLLLLAAGALHCWAIAYALFMAVHTRAMRYEGYHDGYVEHLPAAVAWAETLTVASLWIWLLAGFITAAVRILDEDADALPMGLDDTKGAMGKITNIIRSPALHSGLAKAHSVSYAGLFLGILLLCIATCVMRGGITACEACLVIVAMTFALPHACIAVSRMVPDVEKLFAALLRPYAIESAAAEAAAMGPQLCVIFALADAPGHAYLWQNMIYLTTSAAFVFSTVACARSPMQVGDAALPPEGKETIACLALDTAAALSIILSFPHINTWLVWAGVAVFAAITIVGFPFWRDIIVDWIEPVFVVRSDTDKRIQDPQRQLLRRAAWVASILCAATSLWDINFHHPALAALPPVLPAFMSKESLMLVRWKSEFTEGSDSLLAAVTEALGPGSGPSVEETLQEHRLAIFKSAAGPSPEAVPVSLKWQAATAAPAGKLAEVIDNDFPAAMNLRMCAKVRAVHDDASTKDMDEDMDALDAVMGIGHTRLTNFVHSAERRAAYVAACDWWSQRLLWGDIKIDEEGKKDSKF